MGVGGGGGDGPSFETVTRMRFAVRGHLMWTGPGADVERRSGTVVSPEIIE